MNRILLLAALLLGTSCSSSGSAPSGDKPLIYQAYEALDRGDWATYERRAAEFGAKGGNASYRAAAGALWLSGGQRVTDPAKRATYLEKSIVELDAALQGDPLDGATALNLAIANRLSGRADAAISVLESYFRKRPDDAAAGRMLAQTYQAKDDPAAALRTIQRIALGHETAADLEFAGMCLYAMSQFDEAEKSYRDALKREPENPRIWHNLGITLQDSGRKDGARECFEKERTLRANRQVLGGTLLYFENEAGSCSKSPLCWAGTCGHVRSILLEKPNGTREVLVPGEGHPFESFKAFDRQRVEVEVRFVPGATVDPTMQNPEGAKSRPASWAVLRISLKK